MSKTFSDFKKGLDKHILTKFAAEIQFSKAEEEDSITKHLQMDLSDTQRPEQQKEIKLMAPMLNSERSLIKYAILSWYLPPLTQFELQEVLRTKALAQRYEKVEVYLHSFELCASALFLETDYKLNDVFGNILQKGTFVYIQTPTGKKKSKTKDYFYLKLRKPVKPIKPQRKRGYTDHGSLPSTQEKYRKQTNQEYGDLIYLEYENRKTVYQLAVSNRVLEIKIAAEGIKD